jgi:transposase-like protein
MTSPSEPNVPLCPNCGRRMTLARVTPRLGGLPELQTFVCRPCGVTFTEAVEDRVAGAQQLAAVAHGPADNSSG